MAKSKPGRVVGTVTRKEFITPHFVRVFLTADELEQFANTTIGDNNKILVPPDGVKEVHFPELNATTHEWIHPPKELAPAVRTYTHRGLNLERKELIIDFVSHGDEGPASKWALNAKPGDQLGILMRTDPKELVPVADWYLLAGDATAIPVLSAVLEALPASARGVCIIEVHGKEDEQQLPAKAAIDFVWLHNDQPQQGSRLFEEVKKVTIPEGAKFGHVAAEFNSVKNIRAYLRKEKGWTSDELYAYSYWKAGVAEDKSQSDRQAEKNS
ncbi:siderophore-interacting protein [Gynurincola endophyticus]|uniref:siderophore-interacting protein n=1 Tax=Gynurincola endophyticus TaxID=2479004 RepID=UPI000F8D93ED|nr:siderophore-interacting protein [Gynurincola endophyticus]